MFSVLLSKVEKKKYLQMNFFTLKSIGSEVFFTGYNAFSAFAFNCMHAVIVGTLICFYFISDLSSISLGCLEVLF